jgi:hypothetical protein
VRFLSAAARCAQLVGSLFVDRCKKAEINEASLWAQAASSRKARRFTPAGFSWRTKLNSRGGKVSHLSIGNPDFSSCLGEQRQDTVGDVDSNDL